MLIKCILLVLFFAVTIGVGIYCRRTASDVVGFVLGGRNVGSWLTAFAFGTSYFSAVIFVGSVSAMRSSAPCWPGASWGVVPA